MKNTVRHILLLFALAGTAAYGANMSGIDVVAKEKSTGQVVYQGKTDAAGKFTTETLAPGAYILEFRSKQGGALQVALSGARRAKQMTLPGGVAFSLEITPASKVLGKVTGEPILTADQPAPKGTSKVKIVNGKRFVWVGPEIGSQMGGRWIPEEDAVATNPDGARRNARDNLRKMQDLGGQGGTPGE